MNILFKTSKIDIYINSKNTFIDFNLCINCYFLKL